ncbi:prolyl oligopeptidase family serine peptidase [Candidatus Bathyarchaeota archaeon]|nr:prolyl oligopeptidase family serine peptidase [Candidatus Bathyarchaeota archaeon]
MTAPTLRNGEQKVFFQAGGQWCYLWTPPTFKTTRPISLAIHHHGARGFVKEGAADWLEEKSKLSYLKGVMDGAQCAIAGSHACGDHWGNKEAVAANAALLRTLNSFVTIDRDRVGLMGGGLGGALVWNSVLGPMAGLVKVVVVMQAVASLESVIREHKFKAPLLTAYGLPQDTSDDAAIDSIAQHDPLRRLRGLRFGTPLPRTVIYHGAKDENIPPNSHAIPLAEALRRAGADVTLELFPEVGHAVYAMGEEIERHLEAFFSSCL